MRIRAFLLTEYKTKPNKKPNPKSRKGTENMKTIITLNTVSKSINDYINNKCNQDVMEYLAEEFNLTEVETTTNPNGYPEHTGRALTGFATFAEAEALAAETGGDIVLLVKRDGQHFWYNKGLHHSAIDVLDEYLSKESDIDVITQSMGEETFITENNVNSLLDSDKVTFYDLKEEVSEEDAEILDFYERLYDFTKTVNFKEQFIWYDYDSKTFEAVNNEAMEYYDDSKTYTVAVIGCNIED